MRRQESRRRFAVARTPISSATVPNNRWSVDFVHDKLANGRRFRLLNVTDDVMKECLAAIPDTSSPGNRVVREMRAIIKRRGRPGAICLRSTRIRSRSGGSVPRGEERSAILSPS